MSILKLGTRRSLLAVAQSQWVAHEIEKLNPGIQVELVGIETQGDRIQDRPLSQMEGKDFFVKELDDALISKKVDLCVHSMKDLSLTRPPGVALAAIPKRENPRDVILFRPDIAQKLEAHQTIKIGTSSPRRLENIPAFLKQALPFSSNCQWVEIRGNVNTRLGRLQKDLDGVVLAFAGLIRLFRDEKAKVELEKLLKGLNWMVLPLSECPAAPAQGALAVECHSDHKVALQAISKLHHATTERLVTRERKILDEWGGGCHQRLGATAIEVSSGEIMYTRGVKPNGDFFEETYFKYKLSNKNLLENLPTQLFFWNGSEIKQPVSNSFKASQKPDISDRDLVLVSHSRAVEQAIEKDATILEKLKKARVWVAGTSSWFKLAKLGIWVEGCTESLGFESFQPQLEEPILGYSNPIVLTHQSALKGWAKGRIFATYKLDSGLDKAETEKVKKAHLLYWSSSSQYDLYGSFAKPNAVHACGLGKTADYLKKKNLNPVIFPSVGELQKCLKKFQKDLI